MKPIKRALVSVFDKAGIIDFVKQLVEDFGIEIISTGGTARKLESADIPITQVSDYTGFPEMFDGRVKTLHPKIHGGLLMRRSNEKDLKEAEENNVPPIDLVVCNLYPFRDVISKAETSLDEALEMIDIGGPTQIRAAAKSYKDVAVVSDPSMYDRIITEMHENEGKVSEKTRMKLAKQVFETMSLYDTTIANYLNKQFSDQYLEKESQDADNDEFPEILIKHYKKIQKCRYGENWDQRGYFYGDSESAAGLQDL